MRLIDIDAFRKENRMAEHCEDCERNSRECQYNDFSMMDFCGWLDDAPTVDAAPVKHGRWKLFDSAEPQRYGCSNCSCLSWYGTYRYCPNCGSRMDLEEQDAQTKQSGK